MDQEAARDELKPRLQRIELGQISSAWKVLEPAEPMSAVDKPVVFACHGYPISHFTG